MTKPRLDTSRHVLHFDTAFLMKKKRVDVIGVGAVGSKIAMELAKLGIKNIHLWDGDEVESHNIANQDFYLGDIGKPKVTAMKARIKEATGISVTAHNEYITEGVELGEFVFLAVDTMKARKEIFEDSLKNNFTTEIVVEVRMGIEELRVYGFNPCKREDIKRWTNTLVDDKETVESACSAKTTVGATAGMTSSLAVTRFMQGVKWNEKPDGDAPHFEQILALNPLFVLTS